MNGSDRPLIDFDGSRAIDRLTIESGIPEIQLMGQAALSSLYALYEGGHIERITRGDGRLILLAGSGNNGGDALALVLHLLGADYSLHRKILLFRTSESRSESARFYAERVVAGGVPIRPAQEFLSMDVHPEDLLVEALLGTGQKGYPTGLIAELLRRIAELRSHRPCPGLICLDIPAGLPEEESLRFSPPGRSIASPANASPADLSAPDEIHVYGPEKLALRLHRDLASHSLIRILPMGFSPTALKQITEGSAFRLMEEELDRSFFLKRATDHKYSAGHALLIGGSRGMEGAVIMAARAFFAAGGGILRTVVPEESSREFLTSSDPTVMFNTPASTSLESIRPRAVAIGPGLSRRDLERMEGWILGLLAELASPAQGAELPFVILDAGALPLILNPAFPSKLKGRTLLSPHTGEWKNLGGRAPIHTQALKTTLEDLRKRFGCNLLLKDSVSCLFSMDGEGDPTGESGSPGIGKDTWITWVFSRPQAALAVAGSGDSLTGILMAAFARRRETLSPVAQIVEQSLLLHQAAADRKIHPEASDLPDSIRESLA